jgi:hypothetical protein
VLGTAPVGITSRSCPFCTTAGSSMEAKSVKLASCQASRVLVSIQNSYVLDAASYKEEKFPQRYR